MEEIIIKQYKQRRWFSLLNSQKQQGSEYEQTLQQLRYCSLGWRHLVQFFFSVHTFTFVLTCSGHNPNLPIVLDAAESPV